MSKVLEEAVEIARDRLLRQFREWEEKYKPLLGAHDAALKLIDELRMRGVRSFEGMGIKVDLVPPKELPKEWLDLLLTPTVIAGQPTRLTQEQYQQLLTNLRSKGIEP